MKISQITNSQTKFTSNPLYKVNIKKLMSDGLYENIPVYFSELSRKNTGDRKALNEFVEKWQDTEGYFKVIQIDFLNKMSEYKTYVIELINEKPLSERILSLNTLKEYPNNFMWGEHLQTRPDLIGESQIKEYKGAGELNLYGDIRIVKGKGLNHFDFSSANDEYYEHVGLVELGIGGPDTKLRTIYPRKMEEFMQKVEHKYKFLRK